MVNEVLYLHKYSMKIVKLNAINSTNTFLKDMVRSSAVENFTVVVTDHQTNGKGQFDNVWTSEKGKNLTFSMLCSFSELEVKNSFYLNCAVSLAIYNILGRYIKKKLKIKWPNDILSSNHKLCGILIENTVSNGKVVNAVVGIGLNVNQENFPTEIQRATSLKILTEKVYDKDAVLNALIVEIEHQMTFIESQQFDLLKLNYEKVLYRNGEPSMFHSDKFGNFLGKILGITYQGKLIVELENESLETFDLKEIRFI